MKRSERIEAMALKNGMDITIAPASSWVGSNGKGKWAYSTYIKGMGISEPVRAYPSLSELEKSVRERGIE